MIFLGPLNMGNDFVLMKIPLWNSFHLVTNDMHLKDSFPRQREALRGIERPTGQRGVSLWFFSSVVLAHKPNVTDTAHC